MYPWLTVWQCMTLQWHITVEIHLIIVAYTMKGWHEREQEIEKLARKDFWHLFLKDVLSSWTEQTGRRTFTGRRCDGKYRNRCVQISMWCNRVIQTLSGLYTESAISLLCMKSEIWWIIRRFTMIYQKYMEYTGSSQPPAILVPIIWRSDGWTIGVFLEMFNGPAEAPKTEISGLKVCTLWGSRYTRVAKHRET